MLPRDQHWLIDITKEVFKDKSLNPTGICYGFVQLANQAVINRDLKSFNERLQWMHDGPPKLADSAQAIKAARLEELTSIAKHVLKEHGAAKNVFDGHEKEAIEWIYSGTPKKYPNIINPEQLTGLIQIAQGVRAFHARLAGDEYSKIASPTLTADQYVAYKLSLFDKENPNIKSLIDIEIFLQNLALYQDPKLSTDVYESKPSPEYQRANEALALMAPKELDIETKRHTGTRISDAFQDIHRIRPITVDHPEIVDDVCGASRLFMATRVGDYNTIKSLLDAGADPDLPITKPFPGTFYNYTPFTLAIGDQKSEIIELMWPYRINKIASRINQSITPPMDPVHRILIDRIASIVADDKLSRENIYQALSNLETISIQAKKLLGLMNTLPVSHPDRVVIQRMVAESYQQNSPGYFTDAFYNSDITNDLPLVEIFLKLGIDPNQYNQKGSKLINLAAQQDNIPLMELLLQYNAAINAADANGNTILTIAADKGYTDIFKKYLPTSASPAINLFNNQGKNPLYLAVEKGHIDIVRLLLSQNAELTNSQANIGQLIELAKSEGHQAIADLLAKTARDREHMKMITKVSITYLAERSNPVRQDALVNIKKIAPTLEVNDNDHQSNTFNIVFKAYQQIDGYAAKLLVDPVSSDDVVSKAFKTAFDDILKITHPAEVDQCLEQLFKALSDIRDDLMTGQKTKAPFFKSADQIGLIDEILKDAPIAMILRAKQ